MFRILLGNENYLSFIMVETTYDKLIFLYMQIILTHLMYSSYKSQIYFTDFSRSILNVKNYVEDIFTECNMCSFSYVHFISYLLKNVRKSAVSTYMLTMDNV